MSGVAHKVLAGLALAGMAAFHAPGMAVADGWSITDLGHMSSREECMRRAEAVIKAIPPGQRGRFATNTWTVYSYDTKPGDNDIVIGCPDRGRDGEWLRAYLWRRRTTDTQRGDMIDYIKARF